MMLNIGCGENYVEGWMNVDVYDGVKADMYADARTLPVPDEIVDLVYMGHVLEHLNYPHALVALAEARRVLKDGGWLCAVGPDLDRVDYATDRALWWALVHGGSIRRTDQYVEHRWQCTEEILVDAVRGVFPGAMRVPIRDVKPTWPLVSDVWWQCAVLAQKL